MQEKEVYNVSLKYASVVSHKRFAFNYQYRLTSFYINDYSRLYMRKDVDVNEYVRIKVSIRNIITKNIFYINFGFEGQWISKYNELVIVTFVELNHVFSFQIREYQLAPTNLKVFLGKLYSKRQNIRNMRIEIDHDTLPHR
ncbi:hypothetical protein AB4K20DRAFT_1871352 [Rhizopus microsporus]